MRASSSGPSAIVDPYGRVLAKSEPMTRATRFGRVVPRSERSVYGRIGDAFAAAAALGVAAGLLAARR